MPDDNPETELNENTYLIEYELPYGFNESVVIAAEYCDDEMVQFSIADYDLTKNSALVTFETSPQKGNTIKFFYLNTIENITPLYQPKEIIAK